MALDDHQECSELQWYNSGKYDVVDATHKVYAEYGNVGTEFDYITTSGFGWMNASYQLGLELLPEEYREKLNELVPPERLSFE